MISDAKRILITGGGEFLGSHLCEKVLNEGNEIICLDNSSTGRISHGPNKYWVRNRSSNSAKALPEPLNISRPLYNNLNVHAKN